VPAQLSMPSLDCRCVCVTVNLPLLVTGFEGSIPLFNDPSLTTPYVPGRCEPMHSGKVGRMC
jgi:hypothetical protein